MSPWGCLLLCSSLPGAEAWAHSHSTPSPARTPSPSSLRSPFLSATGHRSRWGKQHQRTFHAPKVNRFSTSGVRPPLPFAQVTVEHLPSGDQVIQCVTNLQAGRLLLHWGVEGGKDYKGGWRLPESKYRPEGTTQYKDRALQSPWK